MYPLNREVTLSQQEQDTVDSMLKAIIQHWKIIGNTSVRGLRESFLQRPGYLLDEDEAWRLVVQKKGIDVLLQHLPWSFSVIKYAWMSKPIYV